MTTALAPTPVIGVVVPVHDAGRYLGASLASLQAQTHTDWLCVVVDDGSRDDSATIAARVAAADSRVQLVRQANAGVSVARTVGLRALPATVEFVAYLDADDLLLPSALEVLHARLAQRPEAVGVYGFADYIDDDGQLVAPGVHPALQQTRRVLRGRRLVDQDPSSDTTFASLLAANPIWPAAVALHRRAAIDRAGGFAADLPVAEDWDLYLRMARQGPFVVMATQVALYRRHAASLTNAFSGHSLQHEIVRYRAWHQLDRGSPECAEVVRVWRFLLARRVLKLLPVAARYVRGRDFGAALITVRGIALSAAQALLPSPPRPSPRLVVWSDPTADGGQLHTGPGTDAVPLSEADRQRLLQVQERRAR